MQCRLSVPSYRRQDFAITCVILKIAIARQGTEVLMERRRFGHSTPYPTPK